MKISELRNSIKLEFSPSGMPGKNEINESINESIRDLNSGHILQRVLITITGSDEDNVWGDITAVWGAIEEKWGELADFIEGFTYDSTNYILTIPDSIIKIDDIYIDDVKQIPMSYSRMLNSYSEYEDWVYLTYGVHQNAPSNGYTCIGHTIHFNKDVSTSVMKVVVYKTYNEIKEDKLIVPEFFRQFLISNPIVILGSREEHIITDSAYRRHIIKAGMSLRDLKQRLINVEHTGGLDAY